MDLPRVPRWAIENEIPLRTTCPDKALLYKNEIAAEAAAREAEIRLAVGLGGFRHYFHKKCGCWHLTKANQFAAWINSPRRHPDAWDLVETAEIGWRAFSIGIHENLGNSRKRREYLKRQYWRVTRG